MSETQQFHPQILQLHEILRSVYPHENNAMTVAIPLTALMAFFLHETDVAKAFSKEFLAILAEEKRRFQETHEFDCNYLSNVLLAESKRIVGHPDA